MPAEWATKISTAASSTKSFEELFRVAREMLTILISFDAIKSSFHAVLPATHQFLEGMEIGELKIMLFSSAAMDLLEKHQRADAFAMLMSAAELGDVVCKVICDVYVYVCVVCKQIRC